MEHESSEQSQLIFRDSQSPTNGGWITIYFIMGSLLGLFLSSSGATGNLMVYLIKEYNVKRIDAAQISNIIAGTFSIAPVAGAIIADAFFGCYPVIVISTFVTLLSTVLLTLTAALPVLRPTTCESGPEACEPASAAQLAFFYTSVGLLAVGTGGSRYNLLNLGASQFDQEEDQQMFFNWYFVVTYLTAIVGNVAIVYVEDSVSWTLGFGLSSIICAVGVVMLLLGAKYYQRPPAQGTQFLALARVAVAAAKKWNARISAEENKNNYYTTCEIDKPMNLYPTQTLRCLNRAAIIRHGDTLPDGSIARLWSLCSVQEVEDFKALIRVFPLWTSSILLSISIGMQLSLSGLQALTMDRSLGRISIPLGSLLMASFVSTMLAILLLDSLLFPLWQRLSRRPTTLQRIGLGHVLNVAAMAASALVERRRAGIVRAHHAEGWAEWMVPMSALWLLLPLAVVGVSEALHFPGQVALFYHAFPRSLQNTSMGAMALIIALGLYLSSAVINVIRKVDGWLPDNINASKLEQVYWLMAATTLLNFGYFVLCAVFYKEPSIVDGDVEAVH